MINFIDRGRIIMVRTHVNPHGGLKPQEIRSQDIDHCRVRTHVNPHGGLKLPAPIPDNRAFLCSDPR